MADSRISQFRAAMAKLIGLRATATVPSPTVDPQYAVERVRSPSSERVAPPRVDPEFARERVCQALSPAPDVSRPPPIDPRFAREDIRRPLGQEERKPRRRKPAATGKRLSDDETWELFAATIDPYQLEAIVLTAYRRLGFLTKDTAKSGDHGLDGVLFRDPEPPIGIQVKRWRCAVGGPVIREFVGSLAVNGLSKGLFLTTGKVSVNARRYAKLGNVTIVDGLAVRELLMVHARAEVLASVGGAGARP